MLIESTSILYKASTSDTSKPNNTYFLTALSPLLWSLRNKEKPAKLILSDASVSPFYFLKDNTIVQLYGESIQKVKVGKSSKVENNSMSRSTLCMIAAKK